MIVHLQTHDHWQFSNLHLWRDVIHVLYPDLENGPQPIRARVLLNLFSKPVYNSNKRRTISRATFVNIFVLKCSVYSRAAFMNIFALKCSVYSIVAFMNIFALKCSVYWRTTFNGIDTVETTLQEFARISLVLYFVSAVV